MSTGSTGCGYTPRLSAEEVYFISCCLRVLLLISLHVGADCNTPLWDTNSFWHTYNYLEPLRTKIVT